VGFINLCFVIKDVSESIILVNVDESPANISATVPERLFKYFSEGLIYSITALLE